MSMVVDFFLLLSPLNRAFEVSGALPSFLYILLFFFLGKLRRTSRFPYLMSTPCNTILRWRSIFLQYAAAQPITSPTPNFPGICRWKSLPRLSCQFVSLDKLEKHCFSSLSKFLHTLNIICAWSACRYHLSHFLAFACLLKNHYIFFQTNKN